jgi:DNA-binding phage protein
MAVLEQGLKVFTSIHKRVYRSFKKELKKLFKLNALYMNDEEYFRILDWEPVRDIMQMEQQLQQTIQQAQQQGQEIPPEQIEQMKQQMMAQVQNTSMITRNDYKENMENASVAPAGDPNVVTQAQKMVKAEALMQSMASGLQLNREEVTYRILEAQEQPNIAALMNVPPPPPDPKVVLEQKRFEHQQMVDMKKLEQDDQRITSEAIKDESQAIYQRIKAESTVRNDGMKELEIELRGVQDIVKGLNEQQAERNARTRKVVRNAEGKLELQNGTGV